MRLCKWVDHRWVSTVSILTTVLIHINLLYFSIPATFRFLFYHIPHTTICWFETIRYQTEIRSSQKNKNLKNQKNQIPKNTKTKINQPICNYYLLLSYLLLHTSTTITTTTNFVNVQKTKNYRKIPNVLLTPMYITLYICLLLSM